MEPRPDGSSEETTTDGIKKKKIRKRRRPVKNLTSYPDSSSDSDSSVSDCQLGSKDDLSFSLSEAAPSYSDIPARVKTTVRDSPESSLSRCDLSELPDIDLPDIESPEVELPDIESPQTELPDIELPDIDCSPDIKPELGQNGDTKSERRSKRPKKKHKKARSVDHSPADVHGVSKPSTSNHIRSPVKHSFNGTASQPSSAKVSTSYLSIADMDTDTELNFEEENQPSTSSRSQGRNAIVEEVIILSSDDEDDLAVPKFNFGSRHSFPGLQNERGNESPDSIVVVSSRSPSPDVIGSLSLPPPPNLDELYAMRIRIRYRNELYEFDGSQEWDIEKVREKLSQATNVPEGELLIYTEDDQKMLDGKSLRHYGVEMGDVLEALRRSTHSPIITEEAVSLKFQKEGLKKPLCISVPKFSIFKEIRTRVAKLLTVDEKRLSFRIDGESVDLCKTPEELELEDDICVDIFEKN